jgi:hypothetical protein
MRRYLFLILVCVVAVGGCSRCNKDDPSCFDKDSLSCHIVPYCHIEGYTWRLPKTGPIDTLAKVREPSPLLATATYTLRLEGNQTGAEISIGNDARIYKDSAIVIFGEPYRNVPIRVKAWRNKNKCGLLKRDTTQFTTVIKVDTVNKARFAGYYKGMDNLGRERLVQIQYYGGPVDSYGCNAIYIFRNFALGVDSTQIGLACNNTRQRGAAGLASKTVGWMWYDGVGISAWMQFSNDSLIAKVYKENPFRGKIEYIYAKKL